jgi:hypothetical protein
MAIGLAHRSNLAALLLGITAPCVAMAEPRLLAEAEMDAVTAAGVVVEVEAYAHAFGTVALTRTDARALTSRLGDGIEVGAGFAEGQAVACCGRDSAVAVGSSAAGGGDVLYGGSFSHVFHGAALTADGALQRFAFGYSAALLLGASSDAPLDSRALDDALSDLSRRLFGGGQTVSGDGPATGFAFAPVYTAGLRWQAARYLSGQRHDLSSIATTSQLASQRLTRAQQAVSWR